MLIMAADRQVGAGDTVRSYFIDKQFSDSYLSTDLSLWLGYTGNSMCRVGIRPSPSLGITSTFTPACVWETDMGTTYEVKQAQVKAMDPGH